MLIRGEFMLFGFWILMSLIDFPATFFVFILPFIISRFIMMLGNWTQHSFVDYEHPENLFKSSITCINVKYNHKCWNDGYHTSHHLKPVLHYTEYPLHFRENIDTFAEEKAIVFDGIDYLKIWWFLMKKNYDALADHIVNLRGMFDSKQEAIDLMRYRTRKMPARGITFQSVRMRA
jgi:fatty acid desaturase